MDLSKYDFVDFGCCAGRSIRLMERLFGGRGIGFDIDPEKVAKARAAGFEAEEMDLTRLDPSKTGTIRFAVMSHFLEHLPTFKKARQCIQSACQVSRDFVLIQQPYFDADPYLFSHGLKLYWSDWHGHTNPMTSLQLHRCLGPMAGSGRIKRALIGFRGRLATSAAREVHSIHSPEDQHSWDSAEHPDKPEVEFLFPVFEETCAIILTGLDELTPPLQKYVSALDVVWDSTRDHRPTPTARPVAAALP
jgi:SAM-dependent methyltransferase